MTYSVQNIDVFIAAYAGACAGMGIAGKVPVSADPLAYKFLTSTAGAWAQAFDTAWGVQATSELDVQLVSDMSEAAWQDRQPTDPAYQIPATYTVEVAALIAAILESRSYFATIGVVPPPSGGGGGLTSFAIFRPGAATSAPFYATWAEVATLVTAAAGAFDLYVDSAIAPAIVTTNLDGLSRLTLRPARGPVAGTNMTLTIADGVQLSNLAAVDGQLVLESTTTTIAALVFNNSSAGMFLANGALLRLNVGATRAFVDVTAGAANITAFRLDFSSQFTSAAVGVPFINLLTAGAVFSTFYTGISPFTQPQDDSIQGPVGSIYLRVYDGSVNLPQQTLFLGTLLTFPINGIHLATIDFTLAFLQASGGVGITVVFPTWSAHPQPTSVVVGAEINTVQQLASPTMTASDAQIVDSATFGITGIADTFTTSGYNAPPPAFMKVDIANEVMQCLATITGDTFTNLTAGHFIAKLAFATARTN